MYSFYQKAKRRNSTWTTRKDVLLLDAGQLERKQLLETEKRMNIGKPDTPLGTIQKQESKGSGV